MTDALARNLPRFSNPKDIDDFVEMLEAFERGEIGPDQFRMFRLLRGVYGQRQENTQMIRVKLPFGLAGKEQLEAMADVADTHSRGFGHVTTRQNMQFHFVPLAETEAAMRRLDEAGMTTKEACGNSVRNVTACELAEVCKDAPFDVTPHAEAIVRHFLGHPLASSLPRKFKIAFSGCTHDCAKAAIHDLGLIAKIKDGQTGFRVVAAGGLSTTPQDAIVLHEFIASAELGRVAEAILRIFHTMGNRDNKHRARLKYVLRKLKPAGFIAKYNEFRAAIDAEAMSELKLGTPPNFPPHAPVQASEPSSPGYLKWAASSVVDQNQEGYISVYVRLELGDMTSTQMRGLGALLVRFGNGTVRFTIDQNIVVPWVDRRSLPALFSALSSLDLARLDIHTAKDATSCPGAETCNLAVTGSRALASAIGARLEREDTGAMGAFKKTIVKVSGCPNSCGQHHIADLGYHGGAKRVGDKAYPIYQLHLGGGVDESGARFGRQVVKIFARRVPEATVRLLALYDQDKKVDEIPTQFFARLDAKRVQEVLGTLLTDPPTPEELLDLGEDKGFIVHTGDGECAA